MLVLHHWHFLLFKQDHLSLEKAEVSQRTSTLATCSIIKQCIEVSFQFPKCCQLKGRCIAWQFQREEPWVLAAQADDAYQMSLPKVESQISGGLNSVGEL